MTPKEKAEDLVAKFFQFKPRLKFDIDNENQYYEAKKCALIAVYEMIEQNGELYLNGLDSNYYRHKNAFLFEVKQEIEKL